MPLSQDFEISKNLTVGAWVKLHQFPVAGAWVDRMTIFTKPGSYYTAICRENS